MKLVSFSVKNYQLTLVVFVMVIVVGLTTMFTMPRAEDPDINPPQYPIIAIYPGTSPADMEELVVKPIEKRVSELEGVKKMLTRIDNGVAVITVDFQYNSNVETKYQELVREINALRAELPAELHSLDVQKVTPTDVNILQVALVSENASPDLLRSLAEDLRDELEKVKSLKKVDFHGITERIIRVDLQFDRLASYNIPLSAVIGSIQSEAANIPGGSVQAGAKTFNVKTSGKYQDLDEIRKTIVHNSNGRVVYLKDVAEIHYQQEEEKHLTRLNGYRCVLVTAAQKQGENISSTREEYASILQRFETRVPANVDLITHFEQAENVNRRIGALGTDFLIAIGLVLITLLPLGWRASLIVMIAIPVSLALGLVAMNAMGFSLNQLSIVGLVVALGLLVDDSIVVVENIERWLREGHSRSFAAIEATKQIGLAVIGCTATLIIAFLPLVFLPEASGEFIRGLPMAVITSVLASMLVSLTIVPFLAGRVLKVHANPEGNIFLRGLKRVISGSYAKVLDKALRRPVITLVITLVLFVSSLAIFGIIGFRLFPTSEKPQFLVNITMPSQTSLHATDRVAKFVESVLQDQELVEYYTTNVGHGNPRIYYNVIPENERPDFAQIFVQLKPEVKQQKKRQLIEKLRGQLSGVPGARIEVKDFEQGPPVEAPVAIRISGENLDTLRKLASGVEGILREIPGAIYVKNEVDLLKSDLKLAINVEKARSLGLQTAEIDRTIRVAVSGVDVGKYTSANDEEYPIRVNAPRAGFASIGMFNSVFVNTAGGKPVPLNQVADLRFETSPATIKHLDKKRYVIVTAYTDNGALSGDINNAFIERSNEISLPEGYEFQIAGEAEGEKEAFGGGFITVVIATVFLFIMVLILEFKTFKSMLIVLSVIPLGIIGGVLMLWLTGNPMSFVAMIGFIGLAGIEVKNSILLVDFTNQLRLQGKSVEEAIREAGEIRFLPIVLTSLTAIGGLIPIAINDNPLISPLALVLIGGLISSTVLSRIVTPVLYKLIPPAIAQNTV